MGLIQRWTVAAFCGLSVAGPAAEAAIDFTDRFTLRSPTGSTLVAPGGDLAEQLGRSVTSAGVVGGTLYYNGSAPGPVFWNNTSTGVDLISGNTGYVEGVANALGGGQQVGQVTYRPNGVSAAHVALWTGSAASMVDLHPAVAYTGSAAYGTNGQQQVGMAVAGGTSHAMLWRGSAGSATDLHPLFASSSQAVATDGLRQAGYGTVGGATHALTWSGSAATAIDLNPPTATLSRAGAVSGTQTGGYAVFAGATHAVLWASPLTPVDLHPSGAAASYVRDLDGGLQVGVAVIGGQNHAALWSGTAGSFIDLNAYLPATLVDAVATDIDGTTVYGYASERPTGFGFKTYHAVVWTNVPEPTGLAILAGGGLLALRRKRR